MGLPLFVAKVESDLSSKATRKHDVLAPTHAGVQSTRSRSRRTHIGDDDPRGLYEARWQVDGSRWREPYRALGRARLGNALLGDSIQVIAAPSPPTMSQTELDEFAATHNTQNDPVDTAMDEFLRLDRQMRAPYAERLHDLLGPRWTLEGLRARARILELRNIRVNSPSLTDRPFLATADSGSRSSESLGTWAPEPQLQARRARVVSPAAPGDLTSEEIPRLGRIIESMQQERRRTGGLARDRRTARFRTTRQQRFIDGLGDRQRSMSPEMWDTLLSTMTPDPEPPSVTSSFASFPTSQSHQTNASSFSAPDPVPRAADGFLSEPPCDSGCENSDPEEEGPSNRTPNEEGRGRVSGSSLRRRHSEDVRRRTGERTVNNGTGPNSILITPNLSRNHFLRAGWVGQLSVGATDETRTQDTTNRETEPHAPHAHNEDDWAGMQLIVRSLARREDIPDEWWLEAGLSRTLGDDAGLQ